MISYRKFGALRLAQYLEDSDIEELSNWEYLDHLWVGESFGFSEWLRLEDEPDTLRALSIHFQDFPAEAAERVLRTLKLPVRPGMDIDELRALLGDERETFRFADDRTTYEFGLGTREPYAVDCTVLHEGGLTYLTVVTKLPSI